MIEDNWVTVEQAPLEAVAEMMRGRLEAEGIEAVLRGNRVAGAAGIVNEFNISWKNPLGGVEVRVRPNDVERAKEILAVDQRSSEERAQPSPTPWWVMAVGAGAVAGVVYWVMAAVSENLLVALVCALAAFAAMIMLGRRSDSTFSGG